MRVLPAAILAHINNRRYVAVHILEITEGATPLRWTDARFEVTYSGASYTPQWFSVGDVVIDTDGNQVVQLVFADVDGIVRGLAYNEEWSYRPATLREIWFQLDDRGRIARDNNGERVVLDAFIIADGRAEPGPANSSETSEPVTLAIVPETDAEGAAGPGQEFSYSCRYLGTSGFKGIQCGYAGPAATCDGRFATCNGYGNAPRYGGSRFAPKAGTKLVLGAGSVTVEER